MMREYQKPEVELISLITEEAVTNDLGSADGEMDLGSNILG